jgi:hypothetical protein
MTEEWQLRTHMTFVVDNLQVLILIMLLDWNDFFTTYSVDETNNLVLKTSLIPNWILYVSKLDSIVSALV